MDVTGLEPVTPTMSTWCSNQLSYTSAHDYTHFKVTLFVHIGRYVKGEPKPIECEEIRWVTLEEIDSFPFPKANIKIIEMLKSK
jgi:adenine-specific DNA glycosylase